MARPIPLRLLTDVATLKPYENNSGRGEDFGADIGLDKVRLEVGSIEKKSEGGTTIVGKAML